MPWAAVVAFVLIIVGIAYARKLGMIGESHDKDHKNFPKNHRG